METNVRICLLAVSISAIFSMSWKLIQKYSDYILCNPLGYVTSYKKMSKCHLYSVTDYILSL